MQNKKPIDRLKPFEEYADTIDYDREEPHPRYFHIYQKIERLPSTDQLSVHGSLIAENIIQAVESSLKEETESITKDHRYIRHIKEHYFSPHQREKKEQALLFASQIADELLQRFRKPNYLSDFFQQHNIEKDSFDFEDINLEPPAFYRSPDHMGFYHFQKTIEKLRRAGLHQKIGLTLDPEEFPPEIIASTSEDMTGLTYLRNQYLPQSKVAYINALAHDPHQVREYFSSNSEAMSLSIHQSDLGYAVKLLAVDMYEEILERYLDPDFEKNFRLMKPTEKN